MPAPVTIVSRTMTSAFWQGAWEYLRAGGPDVIGASGSGRTLIERLRGEMVISYSIICACKDGCLTTFMGESASTSIGLARLLQSPGNSFTDVLLAEGTGHVIEAGPFRLTKPAGTVKADRLDPAGHPGG